MHFLVAKERVFALSSLSYCGKHNFSPNQQFSWRDADLVKTNQSRFVLYATKIRCKGLCGKLCSVKSEHTKRNLPSVEKGGSNSAYSTAVISPLHPLMDKGSRCCWFDRSEDQLTKHEHAKKFVLVVVLRWLWPAQPHHTWYRYKNGD